MGPSTPTVARHNPNHHLQQQTILDQQSDALPTQLALLHRLQTRAEQIPRTRGLVNAAIFDLCKTSFVKIGIDPHNCDHARLTKYINDLQQLCREKNVVYSPSVLATMLMASYEESSARQYMIQIQTHIDPTLKLNPEWKRCLKLAHIRNAHDPPNSATPATLLQIVQLIGDLSRPEQRAIFQQYVTVGRFAESRSHWDNNGNFNPNAWYLHEPDWQQQCLRLSFKTHKGSPTGTRPFSKWIRFKSTLHLSLFTPHGQTLEQVNNYINMICPGLSSYSIRYSAIHRLQHFRFQPEQIALLSGHSSRSKIPSLNRVYMATVPTDNDAMLAMEMSSRLSDEILPLRFW